MTRDEEVQLAATLFGERLLAQTIRRLAILLLPRLSDEQQMVLIEQATALYLATRRRVMNARQG